MGIDSPDNEKLATKITPDEPAENPEIDPKAIEKMRSRQGGIKAAISELKRGDSRRVLHRIGERVAAQSEVEAREEKKIGEILERVGFGGRYFFIESREDVQLRLKLVIPDTAHRGQECLTLEGSFKTLREKAEDLEKVLKLLFDLHLEDRFRLTEREETKYEKRNAKKFAVEIFVRSPESAITIEKHFVGTSAELWQQIKKYDQNRG